MFQIIEFHHRIFIGRLLLWGNIFPAGGLLHKETKIWSWQGYRELNRLTTTKAPSQKTEQTSCRQKKPNKPTKILECVYLHTLLEYTRQKKKKKWGASCREFPVILKMKDIFSLKKKNKIQSSQRLFLSWSSWQLRLTSMETGILPTVTFLSLHFVISWSLLSSFWTDISSSHASTKTPLFIPESPVHETQQAEQLLAVARRWFQLLDPSLKNKRVRVIHKQHLQTQCTWQNGVNRKDFQGWPDSTVRLHPQPTFKTCSRQSVTVQGHRTTGRNKSTAKNPRWAWSPWNPTQTHIHGTALRISALPPRLHWRQRHLQRTGQSFACKPCCFLKHHENSSPIPLHIYKQHHKNATLYALCIEKCMLRQH